MATPKSSSDEDNEVTKKLKKAKKSSKQIVPVLPSISMGPLKGCESIELSISNAGQTEEVIEAVVVETVDKNLLAVSKQEVRGEEKTEIAMGAAEMLNSKPLEPKDRINVDMSFEIQPCESKVQVTVQTEGFTGTANLLVEAQHLMPEVQTRRFDSKRQEFEVHVALLDDLSLVSSPFAKVSDNPLFFNLYFFIVA
ncbi:hypothetical protein Nepgr_025318 [Nepenthes gracilis]|uniref:Uncharacterized protein n=1 Tax=Nepenthes gracilis TaxID=150966 RepID=A0AAD3Y0Y3_NEPGR|nr:hypothetical protein Nepgr_025318 [Nepenthes gracilis]